MIPFHERLGAVLKALNMPPGKFAGMYNINRVSMRKFLMGETKPGLEMLERICIADPRISTDFLLLGIGKPLRDQEHKAAENTDILNLLFEVQSTVNQFIENKVKSLSA